MHEKTFHRITCNHLGKEKLTDQTVKEGVKKYIIFFKFNYYVDRCFWHKIFNKIHLRL